MADDIERQVIEAIAKKKKLDPGTVTVANTSTSSDSILWTRPI